MDIPSVDLDNPEELASIDRSNMLAALDRFPEQIREALLIGRSKVALPSSEDIRAVAVLGMGGSGISGDVVSVLADELRVPMLTVKGYRLPACVDERTLVFAVSYSGNTEETLACLDQATERGSNLIAVSSGGRLLETAGERGLPFFSIPGGLEPRAAIGYLFIPVLAALERVGLAGGLLEQVESSAEMLEQRRKEYGAENPLDDNPTKRLAKDLLGFIPIIYGSEGPLAVAAQRWKTQFNENSKVPAFYNWFPELNHNETVGWQHLADVSSRCHLVVLREKEEHPRVKIRIEITLDLLSDQVGHITQVCARGMSAVERLLDLIYFGDYTSVYLALAQGQDPTPVTRIEELKKRLAEHIR